MPVSFGVASACFRNRDQQAQCTYFDPTQPLVTDIRNRNFPDNLVIIWLGGTASPTLTQFPGRYSGAIVVTAAYTGN